MNHDDKIHALAVANGCNPFWWDGMFGYAWHCGCDDNLHCCDDQCSMITEKSAQKNRKLHLVKSL